MTVLLCPLCSQPRFTNLESLRLSLVNAATQSISCPICSEVLMGLDKLTIHLFGHTINQNSDKNHCLELKAKKPEDFVDKCDNYYYVANFQRERNPEVVGNGYGCTGKVQNTQEECLPVDGYGQAVINIQPNPDIKVQTEVDLTRQQEVEVEATTKDANHCTVNMEDLSFLTSWENPPRSETSKDSESLSSAGKQICEESLEATKEDNLELSEYMSELLNKKLPILNFVFSTDVPDKSKADKTAEGPERKQFKCPTCEFAFENSIVLSMHQELAHCKGKADKCSGKQTEGVENGGNPKGETVGEKVGADILNELVMPRYDCHLCSKSFKMKGSLLVHYRVAHLGVPNCEGLGSQTGGEERNFCCSICSKSFKKEQHLTQHIKTHEGKQWQCGTCNKHFTTKYFLKKHQRLHTGEMPYSCQTCQKTFTFQQSYHKHLLYHSDEKPHQCTQCGRSFKELSTLHNHQRIHSGEKPFACETCGKCFRQRVSYIVHQRIHTGVLPYQCTACKKKFRYKVSQRSHRCTAQPPGVVIRQPGDLVQRILQHRNDASQCK